MNNDDLSLDGAARRDAINDLDCIVCGRWLPTFDRLSRHMAAKHGRPTPNLPGDVELPPSTGRASAQFPERHRRPMAKKRSATPAAKRAGSIPAPSKKAQQQKSKDFNPFIKPTDIGDVGDRAKITLTGGDVRVVDGNFGEQIIVEARLGKRTFDWGITIDSVNHRMLFDRFGKNPKSWRGQVPVTVKMSAQGNAYIAVERER